MITKYHTKHGRPEITKAVFDAEAGYYLFCAGRSYEKDGAVHKYHDTFEAARQHLIEDGVKAIKLAEIQLKIAMDFVKEAESLKEE